MLVKVDLRKLEEAVDWLLERCVADGLASSAVETLRRDFFDLLKDISQ
jgi:hypothetical protein